MALVIVLGAFAAHALKQILDEYGNDIYKTANYYHFIHSLGLIIVGLLQQQFEINLSISGYSFLLGIILFSGSLYAIALTGFKYLGIITPIGGLFFILGWVLLAIKFYKSI